MKKIFFKNGMIDLAQSRLGTKVVYKTDEFFAPAKRIINPWAPVFKEGVFDKHGKWMDGWETRRKRNKGHDYLVLKLNSHVLFFFFFLSPIRPSIFHVCRKLLL